MLTRVYACVFYTAAATSALFVLIVLLFIFGVDCACVTTAIGVSGSAQIFDIFHAGRTMTGDDGDGAVTR